LLFVICCSFDHYIFLGGVSFGKYVNS
jgi:hypothetical protein